MYLMVVRRIDFSKSFKKELKKAPPQIRSAFKKRIAIFFNNRSDVVLNNHALIGIYKGYRSINITGDWRAIFREFENGEIVYFDFLGTHSKLYG